MNKNTTINSADGTPLNLVRWEADSPKAQVLLLHGLAEHMGRYEHVAATLNAAGYSVAGLELRGHGHSGGKRGHVEDWADYRADVRSALDELGEVFLVSHSMGGIVTADSLLHDSRGVRGWVSSNPLLGVRFEPPRWKVSGSRLLNKLVPRLSLSNELDTAWLSRDAQVVERYEADPLVYGTVTPRWYMSLIAAQERAFSRAGELKTPLMSFVGNGDKICSPEATKRFVDTCGSEDKGHKVYEELYHELFNEPEKEQVLADVVSWLDAHA